MLDEPPIQISSTVHGSWTVLIVVGDLDLGTADVLREAARTTGNLAIDVSHVQFIDSSGLRALLELRRTNNAPTLVNPSSPVRDLLELTMTTDAFPVVSNITELDQELQ